MSTIRWGLVGASDIAETRLIPAMRRLGHDVIAVASGSPDRAASFADRNGIAASGSVEEILARDDVDAVYISSTNEHHRPQTELAAAAGKHVLCEKPLTPSAEEARGLFDLAESLGLVLMEAFMYRHHPQTAVVRDLVVGGSIGRLQVVKTTFSFALDDLTNVRALPELDGGAMMDVGCYCVSAIRLLAGEPAHVSGEQVIGPTGVDMALHGTLRCADDVIGQFEASFRSPRRQRVEVVGSEGTITVEAPFRVDWGGAVLLARPEGEMLGAPEAIDVPRANSYRLQLENLADAVQGRAPQLLGREDAVGQARTIEALYRSAAE